MVKKTYTDKEVQKITGYSYAKLYELRKGRLKYGKKISPILEAGKDWEMILVDTKARLVYYKSAIRKIQSQK